MSASFDSDAASPKPARLKAVLVLGFFLAMAGGGAGFYASSSGHLQKLLHLGPWADSPSEPAPEIAFLPLDPIVISLAPGGASKHLKFLGQLEVEKGAKSEVESLLPPIMDVLNGYLRAVDTRQLEDPGAMFRLRAQMLRRVQIITGEGRVRDLLVHEFILN